MLVEQVLKEDGELEISHRSEIYGDLCVAGEEQEIEKQEGSGS